MARLVIYDTITNRIKEYQPSGNEGLYIGQPGVLIDPDISGLLTVPIQYWIHDAGAIREMTQAEKDTLNAEIVSANVSSIRLAARNEVDNFSSEGVRLRAAIIYFVQQINSLRALHSLTPLSAADVKTAIKNIINAGTAD